MKRGAEASGLISSLTLVCFLCFVLSSCTSFRGLPGHGGGKRFDEEQRMLSSSIKATIENMDLSLLRGKKVRLFIDAVETSGSGRHTWSGFRYLNPQLEVRESGAGSELSTQRYPAGYNIDAGYSNNNNITSKDIRYLEFMLKMHCRLEGIRLVNSGQELDLLVGVDVLGTNRSRDDHILLVRDHLGVSTEVTYCCIETKSGKILLERKSTGAKASYSENWMRLTNLKVQQRRLENGLVAKYVAKEPPSKAPSVKEKVDAVLGNEPLSGELNDLKRLEVQVVEEVKNEEFDEDELYQLGLDAASRQDRRELRSILGQLEKSFPNSSYIEVLTNKLSSL